MTNVEGNQHDPAEPAASAVTGPVAYTEGSPDQPEPAESRPSRGEALREPLRRHPVGSAVAVAAAGLVIGFLGGVAVDAHPMMSLTVGSTPAHAGFAPVPAAGPGHGHGHGPGGPPGAPVPPPVRPGPAGPADGGPGGPAGPGGPGGPAAPGGPAQLPGPPRPPEADGAPAPKPAPPARDTAPQSPTPALPAERPDA